MKSCFFKKVRKIYKALARIKKKECPKYIKSKMKKLQPTPQQYQGLLMNTMNN